MADNLTLFDFTYGPGDDGTARRSDVWCDTVPDEVYDQYADDEPADDEPAGRLADRGSAEAWWLEVEDTGAPSPARTVEEILAGLDPRQAEAAATIDRDLLIVAGPGSGKTRTVTHRIAVLLASGVPASQICAVTFTNKAAGELRARIGALVGDGAVAGMWVATFHALCVKILRYRHAEAGLPSGFGIADSDDVKRILGRILRAELDPWAGTDEPASTVALPAAGTGDAALDAALAAVLAANQARPGGPGEGKNVAKMVADAQSAISWAKNHGMTADDMAAGRHALSVHANLRVRYDAELARQGLLDFDDLLLRCRALLAENADVLAWVRRRATFLHVDEFQDTNGVQAELCRLIAGPRPTSGRNICVVGDRQQAIYGFRAASPEAFDAFTTEYPDTKVVVLDQNYRSTQRIVAVSAALIAPLQEQLPPAARTALWTSNPEGVPVTVTTYADGDAEAGAVVRDIIDSISEGAVAEDHAILYRTNAQSRVFEQSLARHAIPYQVVGGLRFYDRAEVRDAIAWLRVLVNPSDVQQLDRASSTPRRRLGAQGLLDWVAASRTAGSDPVTWAVSADVTVLGRAATPVRSFVEDLGRVRGALEVGGVEGALRALYAVDGFVAAACEAGDRKPLAAERRDNLKDLVSAAVSFVDGGPSATGVDPAGLPGAGQLAAFLEQVALLSGGEEQTTPGVQLMTSHAAKGKEFPVTFVVGAEYGFFPHKSSETDDEVDEERRLLFVACSRAERVLRISRAERRSVFGKWEDRWPSPFLADLPDDVEFVATSPPMGVPVRRPGSQHGRAGSPASSARPWHAGGVRRAGRGNALAAPSAPRPAPAHGGRLDLATVNVGDRVEHPSFGVGSVTAVVVADGTVTVRFADKARLLMAELAPLQKLP